MTKLLPHYLTLEDNPIVYHATDDIYTNFELDETEIGIHAGTKEQVVTLKSSIFSLFSKDIIPTALRRTYRIDFRPRKLFRSVQGDRMRWGISDVTKELVAAGIPIDTKYINTLKRKAEAATRIAKQLRRSKNYRALRHARIKRRRAWDEYFLESQRTIRQALKDAGYDGIVYLNRYEGLGNTADMPMSRYRSTLSDAEFKKIFPSARDSYIITNLDAIKSKSIVHVGSMRKYARGLYGKYVPDEDRKWLSVKSRYPSLFKRTNPSMRKYARDLHDKYIPGED